MSWLALRLLASHEGLCSMEFVSQSISQLIGWLPVSRDLIMSTDHISILLNYTFPSFCHIFEPSCPHERAKVGNSAGHVTVLTIFFLCCDLGKWFLISNAKFGVFTVVEIQVEVLWVMTLCSVVVGYQRFVELCSLLLLLHPAESETCMQDFSRNT
jgi:hypothetical protein